MYQIAVKIQREQNWQIHHITATEGIAYAKELGEREFLEIFHVKNIHRYFPRQHL